MQIMEHSEKERMTQLRITSFHMVNNLKDGIDGTEFKTIEEITKEADKIYAYITKDLSETTKAV